MTKTTIPQLIYHVNMSLHPDTRGEDNNTPIWPVEIRRQGRKWLACYAEAADEAYGSLAELLDAHELPQDALVKI